MMQQFLNKFTLGVAPLHPKSGILWRRDLFENEEFEIDVIEDAIEGEHSYKCDEEFRTGWNSS